MQGSQEENARRALAAAALQAREDADRFEGKLDRKPFWRFRQRQALGKALARAKEREAAALRLLSDRE